MDLSKDLFTVKSEFKYAMKNYCMEYCFGTSGDGIVDIQP